MNFLLASVQFVCFDFDLAHINLLLLQDLLIASESLVVVTIRQRRVDAVLLGDPHIGVAIVKVSLLDLIVGIARL